MFVYVCVKLLNLSVSQIIMSLLPISSPPGSSDVVSEPPVPVLCTTPSSGPPVVGSTSSRDDSPSHVPDTSELLTHSTIVV